MIKEKRRPNKGKTTGSLVCNEVNAMIKSPSDTTVYAPGLCKIVKSPPGVGIRLITEDSQGLGDNSFVNGIAERHRNSSAGRHNKTNHLERERHEQTVPPQGKDDKHGRGGQTSKARNPTEQLVIEAEQFKASIAQPKGKQPEIYKDPTNLTKNISDLIDLLRNNYTVCDDNDDDFMHVTCHIDDSLRSKIGRGEFCGSRKASS